MRYNFIKKILLGFAMLGACLTTTLVSATTFNEDTPKVEAVNETQYDTRIYLSGYYDDFIVGNSYQLNVNLDPIKNLGSLNVDIHFNEEAIKFNSATNSKSNLINYDINIKPKCISASYLFNSEDITSETCLFYFNFTVLDNAKPGCYYFDVVIADAYKQDLTTCNIKGQSYKINIVKNNNNNNKTFGINQNISSVTTSVGKTFEMKYYTYSTYIVGSSFEINYDRDYLQLLEATPGDRLQNCFHDINTNIKGSIKVSYVSNEIIHETNLIHLKFKVIKNQTYETKITLTCDEAYDLNYVNYRAVSIDPCKVKINFDPTFIADAPIFNLNTTLDTELNTITLTAHIAEKSKLGAGDFVINFDPNKLTYQSHTKLYTKAMMPINTSKVNQGIFKFGIIDSYGINIEQDIISITFGYIGDCNPITSNVKFTGTGLTDNLTNPIKLNILGSDVIIPSQHIYGDVVIKKEPTYIHEGQGEKICSKCGNTVSVIIPRLLNDTDYNSLLDFANKFNSANVCGTNDYTQAISSIFLQQKDNYDKLNDKCKEALKNTIGNQYSDNPIENCLAKYDRIIMLHGQDNSSYPDYMNRVGSPAFTYTNVSHIENSGNNSIYVFALIICLLATSSIILFVIKVKKEKLNKK